MFGWLTRMVRNAMTEGARQFAADIHPDAPPATLEDLRKLVVAPAPALPAVDPKGDDEETTPNTRKRSK